MYVYTLDGPPRCDREFVCSIHLSEEVPGVPKNEQYYIWDGSRPTGERCVIWRGSTKHEGEQWALDNGVQLAFFEPFEP